MVKNVVVCMDGSDVAKNAWDQACTKVLQPGDKVEFVAVHEPIKPIMPLERPVDVGPFNDIALQGLRDRVKPFVEIAQKKVRSLDRYQKTIADRIRPRIS